jgi:hypothetical protein
MCFNTQEVGMKRLVVLGLLILAVACAQQPPPPAAPPPPPAAAAAPPPPTPPPPAAPSPTLASYNGHYSGLATLGVSGVPTGETGATNPVCVDQRPISMTIRNRYATIVYQDWKLHTLHYRGKVSLSGRIALSHLNGDGSRSAFTLRPSATGFSGEMRRGNCDYTVAMTRA